MGEDSAMVGGFRKIQFGSLQPAPNDAQIMSGTAADFNRATAARLPAAAQNHASDHAPMVIYQTRVIAVPIAVDLYTRQVVDPRLVPLGWHPSLPDMTVPGQPHGGAVLYSSIEPSREAGSGQRFQAPRPRRMDENSSHSSSQSTAVSSSPAQPSPSAEHFSPEPAPLHDTAVIAQSKPVSPPVIPPDAPVARKPPALPAETGAAKPVWEEVKPRKSKKPGRGVVTTQQKQAADRPAQGHDPEAFVASSLEKPSTDEPLPNAVSAASVKEVAGGPDQSPAKLRAPNKRKNKKSSKASAKLPDDESWYVPPVKIENVQPAAVAAPVEAVAVELSQEAKDSISRADELIKQSNALRDKFLTYLGNQANDSPYRDAAYSIVESVLDELRRYSNTFRLYNKFVSAEAPAAVNRIFANLNQALEQLNSEPSLAAKKTFSKDILETIRQYMSDFRQLVEAQRLAQSNVFLKRAIDINDQLWAQVLQRKELASHSSLKVWKKEAEERAITHDAIDPNDLVPSGFKIQNGEFTYGYSIPLIDEVKNNFYNNVSAHNEYTKSFMQRLSDSQKMMLNAAREEYSTLIKLFQNLPPSIKKQLDPNAIMSGVSPDLSIRELQPIKELISQLNADRWFIQILDTIRAIIYFKNKTLSRAEIEQVVKLTKQAGELGSLLGKNTVFDQARFLSLASELKTLLDQFVRPKPAS